MSALDLTRFDIRAHFKNMISNLCFDDIFFFNNTFDTMLYFFSNFKNRNFEKSWHKFLFFDLKLLFFFSSVFQNLSKNQYFSNISKTGAIILKCLCLDTSPSRAGRKCKNLSDKPCFQFFNDFFFV